VATPRVPSFRSPGGARRVGSRKPVFGIPGIGAAHLLATYLYWPALSFIGALLFGERFYFADKIGAVHGSFDFYPWIPLLSPIVVPLELILNVVYLPSGGHVGFVGGDLGSSRWLVLLPLVAYALAAALSAALVWVVIRVYRRHVRRA